ncbi:ABC transporter permease subunit [Bacillus idriensis]|uniref:ABC transporter permease subunit n=1 Tax=Metabacillus idriensis TaxID=324768 RepID=A0A6I2MBA6_9BACI|nr:sugar ABC transporter permease [Metabacillus idriensis]MRX54266.1 ABC transporter permease subunit [Metabacillus idriensis]
MKNFLGKYEGYLFISPWILGFLIFTAFPIGFAFYIGFTDWNSFTAPNFIGFDNYIALFHDPNFINSLKVTTVFAAFAIPLGIISSLTIAAVVNIKVKGVYLFRTALYMPAIVSGVSIALLWRWILDPEYGLINLLLSYIGISGPNWLGDPSWVLPSYIMMAIWGAGGGMLTYLAGLQDIPASLYESADIDGANWIHKFRHITIPMLSPVIFYNLVMGIIGSFKKFNDAYIIGGAGNQGQFFMVYLYENAFSYYKMGYATAMAWVLFVIILVLTILVFRSSSVWVFYQGEVQEGSKKKKRKFRSTKKPNVDA